MIDKMKYTFENLEQQTKKIIKNGVKFCFILCIISLIILLTYDFVIDSPLLFDIGIALFKSNSFLVYLFISSINILFNICGFACPFVCFIAWPTKNPSALSFPAL